MYNSIDRAQQRVHIHVQIEFDRLLQPTKSHLLSFLLEALARNSSTKSSLADGRLSGSLQAGGIKQTHHDHSLIPRPQAGLGMRPDSPFQAAEEEVSELGG